MPHPQRIILALALLGCAACGAPRARPPAAAPVSVVPVASSATFAALAQARATVAEAKRLIAGYQGSDAALAQAERAAALAQNPRAQALAEEAKTRAELALDGYYVSASAQELQRLYGYTGLSDAQFGSLRAAEVALVRGEGARAHGLLRELEKALRRDKKHRVASGESLWSISARPEVYANGYLWPLIWEANRERIRDPDVLQRGQLLRIKANPTVDEVVAAVATARRRMGGVRVGKIKRE